MRPGAEPVVRSFPRRRGRPAVRPSKSSRLFSSCVVPFVQRRRQLLRAASSLCFTPPSLLQPAAWRFFPVWFLVVRCCVVFERRILGRVSEAQVAEPFNGSDRAARKADQTSSGNGYNKGSGTTHHIRQPGPSVEGDDLDLLLYLFLDILASRLCKLELAERGVLLLGSGLRLGVGL